LNYKNDFGFWELEIKCSSVNLKMKIIEMVAKKKQKHEYKLNESDV
jgi:hypothetical protein